MLSEICQKSSANHKVNSAASLLRISLFKIIEDDVNFGGLIIYKYKYSIHK